MKKLFTAILSVCMMFSLALQTTDAAMLPVSETSQVIWQDDDYSIVMTLTVCDSSSMARETKTKSASKRYDMKDSNGYIRATYTLTDIFSYTGTSSTCTFADCTTSTDGTWRFTYKNAYKQGNQAIGSFTAEHTGTNRTISDTLTLTCSATGQIS